ncbi:unnamed protein product [Mycena citricolor]|uniref:Tyrosinase copper-binding domain-containing protein n=1 Tax=Mycena citricolor TaxID=2018698 RepID=A0AAD2H8R9_9AGAR|nr:unnamed protein product [Mycena citricolor]
MRLIGPPVALNLPRDCGSRFLSTLSTALFIPRLIAAAPCRMQDKCSSAEDKEAQDCRSWPTAVRRARGWLFMILHAEKDRTRIDHRWTIPSILVLALLVFFGLVTVVIELTTRHGEINGCRVVGLRKEWRNLSRVEQLDYISAVKCMQTLPANGVVDTNHVRTRYDDFQSAHINLTDETHTVASHTLCVLAENDNATQGQFLPWHRYFLGTFESTLRSECAYQGSIPYWDWSLDADQLDSIAKSPVFDPVYGFGGNGLHIPGYSGPFNNWTNLAGWVEGTGGGCITTGPFVSYNLSVGPGTKPTNHCLTRNFNDAFIWALSSAQVANTTKQPNFERFRIELEGQPITSTMKLHDGGHFAVGGEMLDTYSSPADPIFWLHHANLDRIWWKWQNIDLPTRLLDVSGRSRVNPPFVNITLAYPLKMWSLAPTIPIWRVMDVRSPPLCYDYV